MLGLQDQLTGRFIHQADAGRFDRDYLQHGIQRGLQRRFQVERLAHDRGDPVDRGQLVDASLYLRGQKLVSFCQISRFISHRALSNL